MTAKREVLTEIEDSTLREQIEKAWVGKNQMKMRKDDPARWLIFTPEFTVPEVFNANCYICLDPEFAQMGLPLCKPCLVCGGHVAADDVECDDCGADQQELWEHETDDYRLDCDKDQNGDEIDGIWDGE